MCATFKGLSVANWRGTNPCDQGVLGKTRVGVFDLEKSKLDTTLVEVLNELLELALARGRDLENALLVAAILEGVGKRGLDREEGPLTVGRRASSWSGRSVDDTLVAALDRGTVDR